MSENGDGGRRGWTRERLAAARRWGIAVLAVITGLLVAFLLYSGAGDDMPTGEVAGFPSDEPFRRFANHTGMADHQMWEAYRFAAANPRRVLEYVPCYCGCRDHGDKNNRDCFVDSVAADGRMTFDYHGAT